jgi:ATP-dependent DNA helicase RecG
MRGPLILLAFRIVDAVNSDLPKGFLLTEQKLQADTTGLPAKALREAIINALMHRSFRENSPIQIIRYDNRLEISNPGFSLKSEVLLGEPGSQTRNPMIAAVFHDTNLAETKGSGIKAMRRLLKEAHLAPPTFESSRAHNNFTARLLLHHFLNKEDILWLSRFEDCNLNDAQKQAMIFLREVGAIDNTSYRQLADVDAYRANTDLRKLKEEQLIEQKGKGRATYYILTKQEITGGKSQTTEGKSQTTEGKDETTEAKSQTTEGNSQITEAGSKDIWVELPETLTIKINQLKKKERDKEKIKNLIEETCRIRPFKLSELSELFKRNGDYLNRNYLRDLINTGRLSYRYPEMIKHPDQAYEATSNQKTELQ